MLNTQSAGAVVRFTLATAIAVFAWFGCAAADGVAVGENPLECEALPIGVELGGTGLRVACYENGKVKDVAVPQENAVAVADRFSRTSMLTVEDVGVIKSALASLVATNRIKDVVLALPRETTTDHKAAICTAFSENGIGIRRCIDRTTAYAFAYMVSNPSLDMKLYVEDLGDGEQEVSVVNIGGDVCAVEDVGTNKALRKNSVAKFIKIEDGDHGVVHGVGLYAAVLKRKIGDKLILDVVGRDIGIHDEERRNFLTLVERSVTIPTRRTVAIPSQYLKGAKHLMWLDRSHRPQEIMKAASFYLPYSEHGHEVTIEIDADHNIQIKRVSKSAAGSVCTCNVDFLTGQTSFKEYDAIDRASMNNRHNENDDANISNEVTPHSIQERELEKNSVRHKENHLRHYLDCNRMANRQEDEEIDKEAARMNEVSAENENATGNGSDASVMFSPRGRLMG